MTSSAEKLMRDVMLFVAGLPVADVVPALANAMASAIVHQAGSPDEVDRIVDAVALDMKEAIRGNWDEARAVIAAGQGAGSA